MTSFASYAFNRSHAAAYGVLTVQTAWLKRHYLAEFMAAIMNSMMGNAPKIAGYIFIAAAMGSACAAAAYQRLFGQVHRAHK